MKTPIITAIDPKTVFLNIRDHSSTFRTSMLDNRNINELKLNVTTL